MGAEQESAAVQTAEQELFGHGCHDPDPSDNLHFARTTDQKCIGYRSYGTGYQTLILVHGWSVSGDVYDNFLTELDTSKYRVLVPDLRGTGASDRPATGYTLDNYQRDVLAVANHAFALRFVLVGHSMGGAIAQKIASERPGRVRGLVLMSPVPASGFPLPPDAYGLFHASANDPALQEIVFNISSVALSPADMAHLLASAASVEPVASQESLDAWTQADFADQLHRVRMPTLVMVSDDPFLTAPILQDLVVDPIGCNAELEYFPGSGHYLQVEDAPQTASIFEAFVDDLGWGRWNWCR
ncbi:alpha/beta hydrolase [Bradymonas sediminis]|uniref:Alpha/beta hydrolase n=2 Tax=Bradymonas sediminis TaxID=1548548 RepID=A0A2Z4FR12_9DELT|nr:alpha/beta hydrolase [Bradymonas sediminis]